MVHFWKPWKHAFWPPPGCRKSLSLLPGHALSSIMVWNAGDGPWWAATAEVNPNPCNIHTGLKHLFQWDQLIVCQSHSKSVKPHLQTYSSSSNSYRKNRFAPTWAVHFFHSFANSPAKGGPKLDRDPRPPDLHQNVPNIIANTPVKLMVPGRSFFKLSFWQGILPSTPGHLLPKTECAGVLK